MTKEFGPKADEPMAATMARSSIKRLALSFCIGLVVVGPAAVAQGADRYIRPPSACSVNGDGTSHACAASSGGTGAFNSWTTAMAGTDDGDVLRVDGDFVETHVTWTKSGSEANPIRITSYDPQQRARLRSTQKKTVFFVSGNHVHLDSLRFRNDFDGEGPGSDDMGTCLVIKQPSSAQPPNRGVRVSDNHFEKCNNGISLQKTEDVEIRRNKLELIGEADAGHGHCIYPAASTKNIRVFQNLCVARPDVFGSHCLHAFHANPGAADVDFHDNVCVNFTVGAGVYSGATNIHVYNNTFVEMHGSFGARCDFGGASGYIRNNIFSGSFQVAAKIDSGCSDLEFDNNLYHQTSGTLRFDSQDDALTWAEWKVARDHNSITGDPLLVNVGARDFTLSENSPALDKGDKTYASDLDFYGKARVVGGAVDMGASERGDGTVDEAPAPPQNLRVE